MTALLIQIISGGHSIEQFEKNSIFIINSNAERHFGTNNQKRHNGAKHCSTGYN